MDIGQRKMMAMDKGVDAGKFGVKSFSDSMSDGKSMGSPAATVLSEKQRCAPCNVGGGKMKAQAQPMHGNHGYDT